jgi:serine protease
LAPQYVQQPGWASSVSAGQWEKTVIQTLRIFHTNANANAKSAQRSHWRAALFAACLLVAGMATAAQTPLQSLVPPATLDEYDTSMVNGVLVGFVNPKDVANHRPTPANLPEIVEGLHVYGLTVVSMVGRGTYALVRFSPALPNWQVEQIALRIAASTVGAKRIHHLTANSIVQVPRTPIDPNYVPFVPNPASSSQAPSEGATPTDPNYAEQWHYFEPQGGANLPVAWDKSQGKGVVVAVVDTGYRPHRDLKTNVLPGYDFLVDLYTANDGDGPDADAKDPGDWSDGTTCAPSHSSWHGTHVAGTIAAMSNNGKDVAGIAPKAKLLLVRALGRCGGEFDAMVNSVKWSAGILVDGFPINKNPVQVINMSLEGRGACPADLQAAIASANAKGATIVVAAGNHNVSPRNTWPANCVGVITVAATQRSGAKASYSNFGSEVALAAPGGECADAAPNCGPNGVISTFNSGLTKPGADMVTGDAGTSMASPHVAGIVALMKSVRPSLTPQEAKDVLMATAREFPLACNGCGSGIVDATAAVNAVSTKSKLVTESEPNGSAAKANRIKGSAVRVTGRIGIVDGSDWFVLNLPAGAPMTATLSPNAKSNFDLFVYDVAGNVIGSSSKGRGEVDGVSITNSTGAAADFYAVVRYVDEPRGPYTLDLNVKPGIGHH